MTSPQPPLRKRHALRIERASGEVTTHPMGYVTRNTAGLIAFAEMTFRFPDAHIAYVPAGVRATKDGKIVAMGRLIVAGDNHP